MTTAWSRTANTDLGWVRAGDITPKMVGQIESRARLDAAHGGFLAEYDRDYSERMSRLERDRERYGRS